MTVKQTDEQEGPASLTIYFAERLSNAASLNAGTGAGAGGKDTFAPEAGGAEKTAVLDAFRLLVLLYHSEHGWIVVDTNIGVNAKEDERRRQVFAFKDSLAAIDKEDLFYRWIEIIQFESSQPGGFGEEKQVEVAQKIRDLFQENDVDFDKLWKESVGTDNLAGII